MRNHRHFVFGKKNCWTEKQYELPHSQDAETGSEYVFSLSVISRHSLSNALRGVLISP
jgi:hypothetical protein